MFPDPALRWTDEETQFCRTKKLAEEEANFNWVYVQPQSEIAVKTLEMLNNVKTLGVNKDCDGLKSEQEFFRELRLADSSIQESVPTEFEILLNLGLYTDAQADLVGCYD